MLLRELKEKEMNPEFVNVQVDFYYDTFRSGVVQMPWDLWHFDRKSKDAKYVYWAEKNVYKYTQQVLGKWADSNWSYQPKRDVQKIKLIQLKKLK